MRCFSLVPVLRRAVYPTSTTRSTIVRRFSSPTTPLGLVQHNRARIWAEESARQAAAAADLPAREVRVTIAGGDGTVHIGKRGVVSPATLGADLRLGSAQTAALALVNGQPWDMTRPFELDDSDDGPPLSLGYVEWTSPLGRYTLCHSAAHVLGAALEAEFGDKCRVFLDDGPPICNKATGGVPSIHQGGFFYDLALLKRGDGEEDVLAAGADLDAAALASVEASAAALRTEIESGCLIGNCVSVSADDFARIGLAADKVRRQKLPFERLRVSRATAMEMFADNPLKVALLASIPAAESITVYRCGTFIDLCRGPHITHTGQIKAFDVVRTGAVLLEHHPICSAVAVGDKRVALQRVYGVAFRSSRELKEWTIRRAEAATRDHRVIGRDQKLFLFDDTSPGSPFFLPHGTIIYNALTEWMRQMYAVRGYKEVRTPLLYNKALWERSGHWEHYRDDMFLVARDYHDDAVGDGAAAPEMGLKPMNCPGHCVLFAADIRSYRDLPLRLADFSPLHRNEASGALTGLTRVRRFSQDDAHIFCTEDQVEAEVDACLQMVREVYATLGFTDISLYLSTRPSHSLGDDAQWEHAEAALAAALDRQPAVEWEVNEADGSFYGPKIDVGVTDALGRQHQCATIQLDFNLPQRFELTYKAADGQLRTPVMIHRAVLGSLERIIAVLAEHTAGHWPLWLSPRQIAVCSVHVDYAAYANEVVAAARARGLHADAMPSSDKLGKQVRSAQAARYNYILVVGAKEAQEQTVAVRGRDGKVGTAEPVTGFLDAACARVAARTPDGPAPPMED